MVANEEPERKDTLDKILNQMPWLRTGMFWGGIAPIMPAIMFGIAAMFGADTATALIAGAVPVSLLFLFVVFILIRELSESPLTTLAIAGFIGLAILSAVIHKSGSYEAETECSHTLNMSGQLVC